MFAKKVPLALDCRQRKYQIQKILKSGLYIRQNNVMSPHAIYEY